MFRPINSDDHTKFRAPTEQVQKTEGSSRGQKRDFSYEIEQIHEKHKEHKDDAEAFGEDTFESSAESEQQPPEPEQKRESAPTDRTPPAPGHVDLQA